jgi:hypothetical protein
MYVLNPMPRATDHQVECVLCTPLDGQYILHLVSVKGHRPSAGVHRLSAGVHRSSAGVHRSSLGVHTPIDGW